jgi:hypothetical protein
LKIYSGYASVSLDVPLTVVLDDEENIDDFMFSLSSEELLVQHGMDTKYITFFNMDAYEMEEID